ncbi:hypothetical protein BS47DRAFT_496646 [Hydnum rufescens UP504]|uniref:Uncharacterized protein n=1 Tax=Hydnum rufescens UP504 TaxID=1448309 RepID=A0A9P6AHF1_9AGAM|nr:hypothetical protein BS47DRAFT_496646 [Hydnum rufescens UP504]
MVEATTPSASISVRIVPGAPPPVPPTKSQLKKRKQKTAKARTSGEEGLDSSRDTAPADPVPNSNSLGGTEEEKKTTEAGPEPELALHPSTIALEGQKPPSPIVDQIINRRIKALGKKIQRIALHSSKPESTLNEDQKRSIASLPNLEASLKELEEIKKGIEVLTGVFFSSPACLTRPFESDPGTRA